MNQRLATMLRLSVIVVGGLASVATSKVESGDRANGGDGDCVFLCGDDDPGPTCPAGETCSDTVPGGLYFGGMPTGDVGPFGTEWIKTTAVGGQQTVRLFLDSDGERPINVPFAASVTNDGLSVVSVDSESVVVQGDQPTSAKLRITEPDSDLLIDRIDVDAAPVERMQIVPAGQYFLFDLDMRDGAHPFAVLSGRTTRLAVQLFGASDVRVVDETMTFDTSAAVAVDPEGFADTVAITPSAAGSVEVTAHAAGITASLPVTVVRRADRITPFDQELPIIVHAGSKHRVCFRAEAGDAWVVGAAWSFSAGPGASTEPAHSEVATRCVDLLADQEGDSSLTVTAAGLTRVFDVTVQPPRSRSRGATVQTRSPRVLAGDRAAP